MSLDSPKDLTLDGGDFTFAIVAARFNQHYVDAMLDECIRVLTESGVDREGIRVVRVPGSNEIPYASAYLARSQDFDCIIGLGLVIAGETPHHEVIAQSTGQAMQQIGIDTQVPVINGIVVVHNNDQAEARCRGTINRGREFGLSALEMAKLNQELADEFDDGLGMNLSDLFEDIDEDAGFPELTLLDGEDPDSKD